MEIKYKHILNIARAIQFYAKIFKSYLSGCILAVTYILNKIPVKTLGWLTLFEALFHKSPTYDHIRTINCLCFAINYSLEKDKFDSRAVNCVLLKYSSTRKGYRL